VKFEKNYYFVVSVGYHGANLPKRTGAMSKASHIYV
jgi:hypothetical protein